MTENAMEIAEQITMQLFMTTGTVIDTIACIGEEGSQLLLIPLLKDTDAVHLMYISAGESKPSILESIGEVTHIVHICEATMLVKPDMPVYGNLPDALNKGTETVIYQVYDLASRQISSKSYEVVRRGLSPDLLAVDLDDEAAQYDTYLLEAFVEGW